MIVLPFVALGCTTLRAADTYASQAILGQLYPPQHLYPQGEFDVIHLDPWEVGRPCAEHSGNFLMLAASECVLVKNGRIKVHMPDPAKVSKAYYAWLYTHAMGHVAEAELGVLSNRHAGWGNTDYRSQARKFSMVKGDD